MSCRDNDEVCDWFFRDDDYLRLMYTGTEHTLTAHKQHTSSVTDKVYSGDSRYSEALREIFKYVRMD